MSTHTPAEWAAVLSLATGITFAAFVPWLLLVDSVSARDFDPRPLVRRLLNTDVGAQLLVDAANAKHNTRLALRDAAVSVAALLMLLTATPGDAR